MNLNTLQTDTIHINMGSNITDDINICNTHTYVHRASDVPAASEGKLCSFDGMVL